MAEERASYGSNGSANTSSGDLFFDAFEERVRKVVREEMEQLSREEEIMDAAGAAEFLGMSEKRFRQYAPHLPRHPISDRRYRYLRSELVEWVRSHQDDSGW